MCERPLCAGRAVFRTGARPLESLGSSSVVKNRPKEQPAKTKTSLGSQNEAVEHRGTFLSSHGWQCRLPGTLAGTQHRYWMTIQIRVELEKSTMAVGMEDFAVNFSALPRVTTRKDPVHRGLLEYGFSVVNGL